MPVSEAGGAVLLPFNRERRALRPVLVIAGLHHAIDGSCTRVCGREHLLAKCGAMLAWARAKTLPVAFARYAAVARMPPVRLYPAWIEGFEPTRDDMIFDVFAASFYANPEFTSMISYSGGRFALAGLFAELDCLATILEAQQRSQHVTLISDGFACDPPPGVPDESLNRTTIAQLATKGAVLTADQWMACVAEMSRGVLQHLEEGR